jgi:K+-sensing histidine kinase KdpD
MKWLLAGMGVMALMVVSGGILSTFGYLTGEILITFSPLAPLLGIGVALLRYRLYDIDIFIRRTLQYGLLTAVLIAVYFGVVLLVQTAFVAVTGQESPIAIVISTLVIAALFNPLRQRIQSFIDRRFYRRSYDAAYTLRQFAQTARDEVDLEQLSEALLQSIQETMQPRTALLWLRSSEKT